MNEVALPDIMRFLVEMEGIPIPGILLTVTFKVTRKNHHGQIHGPSDAKGIVEVRIQEVLSQAKEDCNLFMMDYMPLESVFSGTIEVSVMDEEDIVGALHAYDMFSCAFPYPSGYVEMLKEARKVSGRYPADRLSVLSLDQPDYVRIVMK